MAITGSASYPTTMTGFGEHWRIADERLAPQSLVVRLPESDTAVTQGEFVALRDSIEEQQMEVQRCLVVAGILRGNLNLAKVALLKKINLFTSLLDAYYRNTDFHDARPHAPSIGDGQDAFTGPIEEAALLWGKINDGPAPAGVTLPLVLGDGTTQAQFAAALAALRGLYTAEKNAVQNTTLARARRNRLQARAYAIMKAYRETVPGVLASFPALVDTLPRLTPLPGHTPAPVPAAAVFQAPAAAKITYGESRDAALHSYQLRGTQGDTYDEDDAVVLATHLPGDVREFVTTFGLSQPGAQVAFKVFVILNTDNESGSATLLVERPAEVPAPVG